MKKTIVILTHVTFDDSPYCKYVHSHAKALVEQGYHVIVLAVIHWLPILSNFQRYKQDFMKRIKNSDKKQIIDGVEVIYQKAYSFSNLWYDSAVNLNGILYYKSIKKTMEKIMQENEVVLIDAHTFKVEGYVAYCLKKKYANIKTTVTLHGTSFYRNLNTQNGIKQIKKVFQRVDYAICVSERIKKQINALGVENTKVVYNGINQYHLEAVDKEENRYNILTVAGFVRRKNIDLILKSVKIVLNKYKNVKLTIVGEGIERANLEKLVAELKMTENVIFMGEIPNHEVQKLMNENYLFILTSVAEGFGIVYPEAMRAGCITIGTKNEGIDGFLKDGENGFLVNPDVEEIAKLIKQIYEGKFDLEKMRGKAMEAVKELTWENNVKGYIEIFEDNDERKNK